MVIIVPSFFSVASQTKQKKRNSLRSLVPNQSINEIHSIRPVVPNISEMNGGGGTAVAKGIVVIAVGLHFRGVVLAGLVFAAGEELYHIVSGHGVFKEDIEWMVGLLTPSFSAVPTS